jgi:plastocyanin
MRFFFVLLFALAFANVTPTAFAADFKVGVSHDGFSPEKITIKTGDTVTFENQVNMPGGHTIVAADSSFTSKPLATPGAEWSRTFSSSGMVAIGLGEHQWVSGMIIVE